MEVASAMQPPRKVGKGSVKLAAELVRKGGTIIAEPCPECGGIQVRYIGKAYCTVHEDLSTVVKTEAVSFEGVKAKVRVVLASKLGETADLLQDETDPVKQELLLSLMTGYFDLLQKLPQKSQSP